MESSGTDHVAVGTLEALEQRLRRLEFFLGGANDPQEVPPPADRHRTVQHRLQRLEASLQQLASRSAVVAEMIQLHKTHADIFPSLPPSAAPTPFTAAEQLAIVGSCASSYSSTASGLSLLHDSPLPSAESSVALVALRPRLAAAEARQDAQARDLAELRLRSAEVLRRWYEVGVVAGSECWAEWDGRLLGAERAVRREEAARAQEAGVI